ncbi:MAG: hypothetical protein U0974_01840 [Gemmatimonadales bacterium]|nr:hypothetical protein [Gemmatimonadales bacterium]
MRFLPQGVSQRDVHGVGFNTLESGHLSVVNLDYDPSTRRCLCYIDDSKRYQVGDPPSRLGSQVNAGLVYVVVQPKSTFRTA